MQYDTFITPVIVSAIMTAILSPLLTYILNKRYETKKRRFEIRYSEYKQYLQTLEEISKTASDAMIKLLPGVLNAVFKNPENINEQLNDMLYNVGNVMNNSGQAFIKAKNGLHGLRLVCSEQLLKMIDEYVTIVEESFEYSQQLMKLIPEEILIKRRNPEDLVSEDMKNKSVKIRSLYKAITDQMRKELNV